jgi:hypothetical protein
MIGESHVMHCWLVDFMRPPEKSPSAPPAVPADEAPHKKWRCRQLGRPAGTSLAVNPAYKSVSSSTVFLRARTNRFATDEARHWPPRAVLTPR